jgi:hypothetical protein
MNRTEMQETLNLATFNDIKYVFSPDNIGVEDMLISVDRYGGSQVDQRFCTPGQFPEGSYIEYISFYELEIKSLKAGCILIGKYPEIVIVIQ